jgi:hypothetical protein
MKVSLIAASLAGAMLYSSVSFAATLYSQDFNVDDTANWTAFPSAGVDYVADYFYDYAAIGVPAAPNGTGTRGLKLTANNSAAVFGGVTVSPNGQNFSGNYKLSFDMWQNYAGPLGPGGSGTTQFSQYGIGTAGTATQWIGATPKDSVSFGTTLDGGSASDYRAYSSAAATSYGSGNAVYLAPAGAINNSAAYYAVYTAQSAPAAQLGLFPGQTGSTDVGETSFTWRRVTIEVAGGFTTWSIDGTPLAKIDMSTVSLGGGNILFGHSDTNAGASTDANRVALNVTLIDNVKVETVEIPEPTSVLLCLVAAFGWVNSRRRS